MYSWSAWRSTEKGAKKLSAIVVFLIEKSRKGAVKRRQLAIGCGDQPGWWQKNPDKGEGKREKKKRRMFKNGDVFGQAEMGGWGDTSKRNRKQEDEGLSDHRRQSSKKKWKRAENKKNREHPHQTSKKKRKNERKKIFRG